MGFTIFYFHNRGVDFKDFIEITPFSLQLEAGGIMESGEPDTNGITRLVNLLGDTGLCQRFLAKGVFRGLISKVPKTL